MSVKVKKILKKSQAHFREKLKKLRLRQKYCLPIKKRVIVIKKRITPSSCLHHKITRHLAGHTAHLRPPVINSI